MLRQIVLEDMLCSLLHIASILSAKEERLLLKLIWATEDLIIMEVGEDGNTSYKTREATQSVASLFLSI
jgi:hypothetical protein